MATGHQADDPGPYVPDPENEPPLTMALPDPPRAATPVAAEPEPDLTALRADLRREFGLTWPRGWEAVRLFQACLDAGWGFDDLTAHLEDQIAGAARPAGLIVTILRDQPEAPDRSWIAEAMLNLPPWCTHCTVLGRWVIDENGYPLQGTRCRCYTEVTPEALAYLDRIKAGGLVLTEPVPRPATTEGSRAVG